MSTNGFDLKHRSRLLLDGPSRAGARAQLKGIGYDDEALSKPIIGVASTWIETMPCNFHLRALAAKVKEGIRDAGGTPMELNTVAISDGITMGTTGMKTSLVSREVIADSIELVARGHFFDGVIALSGCDKTIPGTVMALCRLDVPSVMLYGGSIPPGHFMGNDVTIGDVYEAIGAHATGRMSDEDFAELESVASPGAGACGGQFTANTMAMAFEVLGISPMAQNLVPAQDPTKAEVAYEAGKLVVDVLKRGLRPSEIITKEALENAVAGVACSRRLDERRPAPARGRARDRRGARHRRLRPGQRAHAAAVRPQARRAVRRGRPLQGRRRSGHAPAPAGGRPAQRGHDHRHGARRSASWPRRPTRPRASASCAASTSR